MSVITHNKATDEKDQKENALDTDERKRFINQSVASVDMATEIYCGISIVLFGFLFLFSFLDAACPAVYCEPSTILWSVSTIFLLSSITLNKFQVITNFILF